MTKYTVTAWADDCGAETVYQTDTYGDAKSWIVNYVLRDGTEGWEEFVIKDREGQAHAAYDTYGWTHY